MTFLRGQGLSNEPQARFFEFSNNEIAANSTEIIDFESRNLKVKAHLPFTDVVVNNTTNNDVFMLVNQQENNKETMHGGSSVRINIPVRSLEFRNKEDTALEAGGIEIIGRSKV